MSNFETKKFCYRQGIKEHYVSKHFLVRVLIFNIPTEKYFSIEFHISFVTRTVYDAKYKILMLKHF